jgi:uncharacterized protein (DUF433 family)
MAANDVSAASRIRKTPNVIGGDACIRTTRIAVWMLVEARRLGMSDQELLARYDPPLTQSDLDAAMGVLRKPPGGNRASDPGK